jgi:hypothetical protein
VATITMNEIRQAGVTLTDLAEQAGVNYGRLWRQTHGGLAKGLFRDEVERLERVLADRRQPA